MVEETSPGAVPAVAPMPAATAPAPAAPAVKVSLDDFCRSLSRRDRRVELIAMFRHTEVTAKHLSDTAAAYEQRYTATAKRPVK